MHICFLSWDYPSAVSGGGVGNQVHLLGRTLVAAGHRVTVVARSAGQAPGVYYDSGIFVHRVNLGNLHWYAHRIPLLRSAATLSLRELEYAWAGARTLSFIHSKHPIDIVEGTEIGALGALALVRIPLLIRLHGEEYTFRKYTPGLDLSQSLKLARSFQRLAMRKARLLISPSRAHAREISNELQGRHPSIEVIPNWIHYDTVPPCGVADGSRFVVLFAGRLERGKGVLVLLEAAGLAVRKCPEAWFVLAGSSHPTLSRDELNSAIDRLSLRNHVNLPGHVEWSALQTWYQRSDVFVLPSYYETFGVAALEAMAHGLPVIAAGAGALQEVVVDGETGLLVPPGDSAALARALMTLREKPYLRRKMGEAGRRRALAFGLGRVMPLNMRVYHGLLS